MDDTYTSPSHPIPHYYTVPPSSLPQPLTRRHTTKCASSLSEMAPPNIPFIYRLWHLWIEPAMALNGAWYLWSQPLTYHEYMPITAAWHPKSQIVYNQLAATYMLFAFNQAVTLRVVRDLFLWKVLLFGMALCDAAHMYSIWAEMGTRELFSPGNWRFGDQITMLTTVGPFFLRLAFVLGIGLKTQKQE